MFKLGCLLRSFAWCGKYGSLVVLNCKYAHVSAYPAVQYRVKNIIKKSNKTCYISKYKIINKQENAHVFFCFKKELTLQKRKNLIMCCFQFITTWTFLSDCVHVATQIFISLYLHIVSFFLV